MLPEVVDLVRRRTIKLGQLAKLHPAVFGEPLFGGFDFVANGAISVRSSVRRVPISVREGLAELGADGPDFGAELSAEGPDFGAELGAEGPDFGAELGAEGPDFGAELGAEGPDFGAELGADGPDFGAQVGAEPDFGAEVGAEGPISVRSSVRNSLRTVPSSDCNSSRMTRRRAASSICLGSSMWIGHRPNAAPSC